MFLGWTKEKSSQGHNTQNYDLQRSCFALQSCEPTTIVNVIQSTNQTYISMNFEMLPMTVALDDAKFINKCENLRFVYSFKIFAW